MKNRPETQYKETNFSIWDKNLAQLLIYLEKNGIKKENYKDISFGLDYSKTCPEIVAVFYKKIV